MSLNGKTQSLGSGGPQADHGLNPKTHGATDRAHDPTSTKVSATSVACAGARAFRSHGVATPRKGAILPQPDDALS